MFLKKNKLTRNNIFNLSNQLEDVRKYKAHAHKIHTWKKNDDNCRTQDNSDGSGSSVDFTVSFSRRRLPMMIF